MTAFPPAGAGLEIYPPADHLFFAHQYEKKYSQPRGTKPLGILTLRFINSCVVFGVGINADPSNNTLINKTAGKKTRFFPLGVKLLIHFITIV